jgi:hypothetical protein
MGIAHHYSISNHFSDPNKANWWPSVLRRVLLLTVLSTQAVSRGTCFAPGYARPFRNKTLAVIALDQPRKHRLF